MIRSLAVIACLIASFTSVTAHAVDMFTFDEPQASNSPQPGPNESQNTFRANFNSAAMEQETVVVNLPHKQISAKRKPAVGDISERIMPYALEGQNGTVMVNSSDNEIHSMVVFDEEAKRVFKGQVQADGAMLFTEVDIDTYICDDFATHEISSSDGPQAADTSYYQSLTNLTLPQVTSLQSRPGASKVLYIDYLAGSVSGTRWNVGDGAPATIVYDNYSYDGDASTFSLIDLQSMYAGWAEAAEDYAPFDVNVTTDLSVYNAAAHRNKSKIVSTSTNWRGSGGVAYVGVFGERNDDYFTIGWTFNSSFGSMGMTNSHESGHQMGLSHDGTSVDEYYSGLGNSGPIMGGPFRKDFVHWGKGDYPDANQTQNDISIIQGRLGTVADDHGNTNGTASPITEQEIIGFISPEGVSADVDVFSFTLATSKTVNLSVRSLFEQFNGDINRDNTAGGLNLSAKIELRDSSNAMIQQKLASSIAANNGFSFSGNLAAGTYYLSIQNQAYAGANFNEYGNGGFYQIINDLESEPAPDLLVQSPAVDNSSVAPGQSFVFSASVRNQGNLSASATTLRYYLSQDSTITTADLLVGTDSVSSLSANASSAQNIALTAPSNSANIYYGACVDNVSGETNTDNNCSAGVLLSVVSTIDLVVQSPAVNDSTLNSGQPFVLSATVRNQGNTSASATSLTYYRSTNATISTSDTSVGTDAVSSLNANLTSPENINLSAPISPGNYYYGACVAAVSGETNTSNNCSAGILINVESTIDLIIESPAVNDSTLDTGQSFVLSASVKNQGNSASGVTSLTYYRSSNATISASDVSVGTDAVAALSANQSSPENINLSAPNTSGTYYYGACVNVVSGETETSNNCSIGVLVNVVLSPDNYEPNNDSTTAKTIFKGQIQAHSIHEIGDQDWLKFTLSAPAENLLIETNGSGASDTRLWLYDSSIGELAFDNDGGVNTYSRISIANELPAGTYYILIDELGNNAIIENYTVSLNFDSTAAEEDQLCLPIKASNGKIVLICL